MILSYNKNYEQTYSHLHLPRVSHLTDSVSLTFASSLLISGTSLSVGRCSGPIHGSCQSLSTWRICTSGSFCASQRSPGTMFKNMLILIWKCCPRCTYLSHFHFPDYLEGSHKHLQYVHLSEIQSCSVKKTFKILPPVCLLLALT